MLLSPLYDIDLERLAQAGLTPWSRAASLAHQFLDRNWSVFKRAGRFRRCVGVSAYPFISQEKNVATLRGWKKVKGGWKTVGALPLDYVRGDQNPNVLVGLKFNDSSVLFVKRQEKTDHTSFMMVPGVVFEATSLSGLDEGHISLINRLFSSTPKAGILLDSFEKKRASDAGILSRSFGQYQHTCPVHDHAVKDAFMAAARLVLSAAAKHGLNHVSIDLYGRKFLDTGERSPFKLVYKTYGQSNPNFFQTPRFSSPGTTYEDRINALSNAHSTTGLEGIKMGQENLFASVVGLEENVPDDLPNARHQTLKITALSAHNELALHAILGE